MKNKILLGAMALAFSTLSMNVNAQLEVQTSGDVQISKNLTVTKHVAINGAANTDSVALRVSTPDVNEDIRSFGVYSTAIAPSLSIIRTGCSVGLVGQIISQNMLRNSLMPPFRRPFYAGVAGLAPTGIAIYGAADTSLPTVWTGPSYAGYFDGDHAAAGCGFIFRLVQLILCFLHLLLHFLRLAHELLHVGASSEAAEILSCHDNTSNE